MHQPLFIKRLEPDPDGTYNSYLLNLARVGGEQAVEALTYLKDNYPVDVKWAREDGVNIFWLAHNPEDDTALLEFCYQNDFSPDSEFNVTFDQEELDAAFEKNDLTGAHAADLRMRYNAQSTPLNISVFMGDIEKVRLHLKYGANPLFADKQGADAFTVLDDPRIPMVFGLRPEHDNIRALLMLAVQNNPLFKLGAARMPSGMRPN